MTSSETERDRKPEEDAGSGKSSSLRHMPLDGVLEALQASREGLSRAEAQRRVERYGYNEIAVKRESALLQLLSYFRGPIPYMIMTAAVVSAVLGHFPTLGIILTLLILNAVVGFREERQAGNAIAALQERLAVYATVKRDGEWKHLEARLLVPGDVIRLRIGSIIPADARLLSADEVLIDQSALTGESIPVRASRGDAVYSGSLLKQGEVDSVVYATGTNTFYGKTAQLVESSKSTSHLQKAIMKIADYLLVIAVILAAIIVAVVFARTHAVLEVLQFVLVLIVAAVPVAMPAVLSVTMALGARKLATRRAVVTRLSSVEELAGVDVLCTDKTGTLTQAKLTAGDPFTFDGAKRDDIILEAALASREEDQDPIDMAILSALADKRRLESFETLHFNPFDPVHKRTEALVRGPDGRELTTTKGAPQVVLSLDPTTVERSAEVEQAIEGFAKRGFRSLGVARKVEGGRWSFRGIIPLFDPVRDDSSATIRATRSLGLQVKMVTGDQLNIAKEIARQLGMGTNILNARAFDESTHSERARLDETIEQADGFAQVFPEHKHHIVSVLQKRHHIVAMTGDGVNDAPALKKADAGIAVSGATDAARSAASIALLDPGLSVIIDAIRESRRIFERMLSYAVYRIAETVALLTFIAIATIAFDAFPVTPVMIVFLAILNDGSILSIAYDNTRSAPEPLRWNMSFVMGLATILGFYAAGRSLGIYAISTELMHLDLPTTRSMIYLSLSVGGILTLYAARARGPFWSVRPGTLLLVVTLLSQVIATLIAVYGLLMTPLGWANAGIVWGYNMVTFVGQDLVKLAGRRVLSEEHSGYFGRHARSTAEAAFAVRGRQDVRR